MTNNKKTEPEESLLGAFTTVEFGDSAINFALILIRVTIGLFMIKHGVQKILDFDLIVNNFPDPLSFGSKLSLQTTIFIEIFCSIFVLLGFLTRLFLMPLIIQMLIIVFFVHIKELFTQGEIALLYLMAYLVLLFLGPGRFSFDAYIQHKRGNDNLASDGDDM